MQTTNTLSIDVKLPYALQFTSCNYMGLNFGVSHSKLRLRLPILSIVM